MRSEHHPNDDCQLDDRMNRHRDCRPTHEKSPSTDRLAKGLIIWTADEKHKGGT